MVAHIGGSFYFKPEAGGRLWLSPHDEIRPDPCDAAPEEIDVAIAIDRFEQVVDWRVAALEHKWAGLRSFAPDRLPVYGFDVAAPGFFWCAGQGGFGIQTAPAAAKLAAALLLGTAEVARYLRDFRDGTGGEWDFDDFLGERIADPRLDSIRKRASRLEDVHDPDALAALIAEAETIAARDERPAQG
jgi:glycine/D-amino acid oxidase-like deaminating enzyme